MNENIVLTGSDMTIDQFVDIVRKNKKIEVSDEKWEELKQARQLVFDLADQGVPIYGFTVGVGWNKDKRVFSKYFAEYNRNLIYAHCVASGEPMAQEHVRAAMLARLATFLVGKTGVQPELIDYYKEFLNRGIHPVVPWDGSVGQADIATMSHIGLAIIGEGDVFYKGKRMPAEEALKLENMEPLELGPKDGLAIVSTNGQAAGLGCMLLADIKKLITKANILYALSLEGLDGNVTPLNEKVNLVKNLKGQIKCSNDIRKHLENSYLNKKEITKKLQDPLSYRDVVAVHGAVLDSVDYVQGMMENHLNTTEDNPCILLDERKIISCANFEATNWALGFEMLGLALGHVSRMCAHRTIKLANPEFTGLSRFLSPNEGEVQAYQTIQKHFTALDSENRHLANPSTLDFYAVAGDIEDHANNTVQIMKRLTKMMDNIYNMMGVEMLHAAQAVDLREEITLGNDSKKLYDALRKQVRFLDKDRPLTFDIEKAKAVFMSDEWL
ncbi:aromatic amino acid lyase [Acidaminobacter sp. JC074]|uniref:HAL/PAL/TAL family ammonia-lyase n=1 Tax=Acidaminobacter sp. JC074 TaxID=2530199 RepID=UPI001F0D2A57|nr:aromatic amino acid ammonia-lyase [Acidaminobacter sp. JC074]MCH4886131.1 aromatic amino acid lyase [Acidaminobacter sp. JC074]